MVDLKRALKGMCWCTFGVGTVLIFASLYGNIQVDKTLVFATGAAMILVSLLMLYYALQQKI